MTPRLLTPDEVSEIVMRHHDCRIEVGRWHDTNSDPHALPPANVLAALAQEAEDLDTLIKHVGALAGSSDRMEVARTATIVMHAFECPDPTRCPAEDGFPFDHQLVRLIRVTGDPEQRARLAAGFPMFVQMVELVESGPEGRLRVEQFTQT